MNAPSADLLEKLGSFYLGRDFDLAADEMTGERLMYEARDLCTHAMCVGMTGSGKTGLCMALLEEAAIDGIPAICIDPKGDLANRLLTFPELRPNDFRPWLDEGEATRKGMSMDQYAESTANQWREGLEDWGQSGERVRLLRDAVDVAIYTPGSNIGLPLTVLKSFDAPPPESRGDAELVGDRITGAVSGLLTLMGVDADPMTSTEHILLSSILSHQWEAGKNVPIDQLIRLIQAPPMSTVGVVDVDSFMGPTERGKLAMRLNNLLASPSFASWLEGDPLSIKKLLYTDEGNPRHSILSIAHLNDSERMFFVTILLNELLAWVRTQSGTRSLRAMFYMDEVAGYFPPVRNPPSKPPMLTLLKQARAFGLGITLATQNPVDLDYKGLSNIGTWFLGRLQTERDKERVLAGLEGAAGQSGQRFDRGEMEGILARLGSRVFMMNNVHDDHPIVFQSRWAMSYLAGPLARNQISDLMADRKQREVSREADESDGDVAEQQRSERPVVPVGVPEKFLVPRVEAQSGAKLVYRPALYAEGTLHFIRKTAGLDQWREVKRFVECKRGFPDTVWEQSRPLPDELDWDEEPDENFGFGDLPDELRGKAKLRSYKTQYKEYLYRHHCQTIFKSPLLKAYAPVGDEGEARVHFRQLVREQRDDAIEKLRKKYDSKLKSKEKQIQTAEARVAREKGQSHTSMISAGTSVVGALLGGLFGGRRTKMSTVARGIGYASQQGGDVRQAEAALQKREQEFQEIEEELQEDLRELKETYDAETIQLEAIEIHPRKSDLKVDDPMILWLPLQVDSTGIATPLYQSE